MSYLSQVQKAKPQAPVLTIIGFPGVGKSTLAARFPNPIFVQAENATSVFESWPAEQQPAFFPRIPSANGQKNIRPSEIVLAQLRELATAEHDFKTVVIDALTTLHIELENEVVAFDVNNPNNIGEAAGGYGKGYLAVAAIHSKVRHACEYLRQKGIAVVFLAHSGINKVKNRPDVEPYSTWSMDMHEASRKIYIATSDAVLYLKSKEFIMGGQEDKKGNVTKLGKVTSTGERVIITQSDGTIGYVDAKNRYNMPNEIESPEGENPLLQFIPFFNQEAN